jgi:hypothetical protein
MYRPTKSGMGNSVVRLVFVSFDYFSNFQFPEKSSGRGDMTLCQQRDMKLGNLFFSYFSLGTDLFRQVQSECQSTIPLCLGRYQRT